MVKALEKQEMSQDSSQPWHLFLLPWPLLNHPICVFRIGPKWLTSSESSSILTKPPSRDYENLVPTEAEDGDPHKTGFKPFLNPVSSIISSLLVSYYPFATWKTRKSAFEEEGLLCTLRDSMSQPRVLQTSRERWEIGFEAWQFSANHILVSKFLMHIHLFWEFVFLGTLKTGKQLSHLLERVTKRAWETRKLSRLSQYHWDPQDNVGKELYVLWISEYLPEFVLLDVTLWQKNFLKGS